MKADEITLFESGEYTRVCGHCGKHESGRLEMSGGCAIVPNCSCWEKTYIYLASPIQEHIAHEPAAHA